MSIATVDLSTRAGFPFAAAARPEAYGPSAGPPGELESEPGGLDAGAIGEPAAEPLTEPRPPTLPPSGTTAPAGDLEADRSAEPVGSDRLLARAAWADAFAIEERRVARYGRPTTVVLAELDGFEALSIRLGEAAAERIVGPTAAVLAEQARGSDLVARVDRARFAVLMPETDEVAATHSVERVRDISGPWLAAAAVSVRLAVGWASSPAGGTLTAAMMAAEQRMNADRRLGRGRRP